MILLDRLEQPMHVGPYAVERLARHVRIWKIISHSRLDMPVWFGW
jgi:hypothetical protein